MRRPTFLRGLYRGSAVSVPAGPWPFPSRPAIMFGRPALVLLVVAMHRLGDPLTFHVGFPPVITAKLLSHTLTKRLPTVSRDLSLVAFGAFLSPRTALALLAFVDAHRVALAKAAYGFQFHPFSFGAKHFAVFLCKVAAVVLSRLAAPSSVTSKRRSGR